MNLIPSFLHKRIAHRPNLVKIIDNIGWLFLDKILRMGVGLLVGVWVARYLGPEQFGQLNYAIAFVSIFSVFTVLGFNDIVVRDLIREPENIHVTLGTSFVLQIIGGIWAFFVSTAVIMQLRFSNDLVRSIVYIVGFGLIFQSSSVIKYWFESQVQSRYTVLIENGVFLIVAVIRVVMIVNHVNLIAFAWAILAEYIMIAVGLFTIYAKKVGNLHLWRIDYARAKILLRDSWPLMLSSIAIMVYMRIDQIMLGEIIGEKSVGIYSAALRISEIWYTIPVAISASVLPSIIESKKICNSLYIKRMQQLLDFLAALSFAIAIAVTLSSGWIVDLLFGNAYSETASVLMIHVWAGIFVFVGVAGSRWYLIENLQKLILYRTVWGAVMNIILNILLIPRYGASGAAISTVISYGAASYFFDALSRKTLPIFYLKSRAIFMWPFLMLKIR